MAPSASIQIGLSEKPSGNPDDCWNRNQKQEPGKANSDTGDHQRQKRQDEKDGKDPPPESLPM